MLEDLLATFDTERLKTLSVWAEVRDEDLDVRLTPRSRTLHEHMVHQCISEATWMRSMLAFPGTDPMLPAAETRTAFVDHYLAQSTEHLHHLRAMRPGWFEEPTTFFGETKSRFWVLLRRLNHTAHHRGQMTVLLRSMEVDLYSTYGPTADTGGLFQNKAPVIYRHLDLAALQVHLRSGGSLPPLPGPGSHPVTERPT